MLPQQESQPAAALAMEVARRARLRSRGDRLRPLSGSSTSPSPSPSRRRNDSPDVGSQGLALGGLTRRLSRKQRHKKAQAAAKALQQELTASIAARAEQTRHQCKSSLVPTGIASDVDNVVSVNGCDAVKRDGRNKSFRDKIHLNPFNSSHSVSFSDIDIQNSQLPVRPHRIALLKRSEVISVAGKKSLVASCSLPPAVEFGTLPYANGFRSASPEPCGENKHSFSLRQWALRSKEFFLHSHFKNHPNEVEKRMSIILYVVFICLLFVGFMFGNNLVCK